MIKITVLAFVSVFSFSAFAKPATTDEFPCKKEIAIAGVDALRSSATKEEQITKANFDSGNIVKAVDQSNKVDSWTMKLPYNDTCSATIAIDLKKSSCALDTAKVITKDCTKK